MIPSQVKKYMKKICELPCPKIFHNAQYDVGWLEKEGYRPKICLAKISLVCKNIKSKRTKTIDIPEMVIEFDKIIVMAEFETIPEYLFKSNKAEFWDIKDPKGIDDKGYKKIISQIKSKIKLFIKENIQSP